MLDDGYDWVSKEIQQNLYPYLQGKGISKLTSRDARVFEEFFSGRRKQLAAFQSPSMHFEILSQIEHWTVTVIHSLKLGESVQTDALLTSLLSALSGVYESLKAPVEAIEVKSITAKGEIKSQVVLQGVRKIEDTEHLASAIEYQFSHNVWIIFVTMDEKHILSNQKRLFEICALQCCKPDYALDYARDVTRELHPVQYYANINPKSPEQESFARTVENSLQISVNTTTPQDAH
jgi:hypothetical protein